MKKYEFRSLSSSDLPAMADLLIGRQQLESKGFPFLSNNCLNEMDIIARFKKLFASSKVIGVGAFVSDQLVGYVIGEIRISNRAGRTAYVPYEGIAIKTDQPPELIRHLYTKVSVLWLEQGCFSHSALVPIASDVYYEAFLQLSFAIEQVHAVLHIADYKPFDKAAAVQIRIADKTDRDVLGKMSSIIASYQNAAPVFMPALPEVLAAIKEGFKGLVEEDGVIALIAEKDGMELGFSVYEPITPSLMTPDDAIELSVAGTYHSQMGSGIGKALMNAGCEIVKEKGYGSIALDWRITNLASSTFWPKCGFKPVAYRMARYIDSNYAWANFNNPSIKKS